MAILTLYACDVFPTGNVCPTPANIIEFTIDTEATLNPTLAEALTNHAVALDANTAAMDDFFTLSADDVSLISATILITFIVGNSVGKIASMMRKA
jgi:hypothetical protein